MRGHDRLPAVTRQHRAVVSSPAPCHLSLATVPGWSTMYYVLTLDFGVEFTYLGSSRKWAKGAASKKMKARV